jgi:hypothetical protein
LDRKIGPGGGELNTRRNRNKKNYGQATPW